MKSAYECQKESDRPASCLPFVSDSKRVSGRLRRSVGDLCNGMISPLTFVTRDAPREIYGHWVGGRVTVPRLRRVVPCTCIFWLLQLNDRENVFQRLLDCRPWPWRLSVPEQTLAW